MSAYFKAGDRVRYRTISAHNAKIIVSGTGIVRKYDEIVFNFVFIIQPEPMIEAFIQEHRIELITRKQVRKCIDSF